MIVRSILATLFYYDYRCIQLFSHDFDSVFNLSRKYRDMDMYNFKNTTSPNATSNSPGIFSFGEFPLICHEIYLLLDLL